MPFALRSTVVSVALASLVLLPVCSSDEARRETSTSGPGPTSSTTSSGGQGGQGANGTGGENAGGSGTGGDGGVSGSIVCDTNVGPNGPGSCTDADATNCICLGCTDDASCEQNEDCVCPDCHDNSFCSDVGACIDDGVCSPYNEGCACVDCFNHPQCP